jgi:SNF2 family DNA or RNA helicase
MGLGKTAISILYVEMNHFEKVVVVTPNSLKFNYLNEIEKFTNSNAYIVGWRKNNCSIEDAKYVIINYDFFNPNRESKKRDKDGKKEKKDRFLLKWQKLGIYEIDAVICDESQKLKNTKANTYKNFNRTFNKLLFKNGKISKIFLSGTPAPNRAYELYTVLNQISPLDFPTKEYFYEYYCGMSYDHDSGWGYVSNTAEQKFEELYHKTAPYTHRKRKFEVLLDLPDKIYQKIMFEMDDDEYAVYDEIEEGVVNEFVAHPNGNPLTTMLRLRQYTASLKIKHVIELVENILETGEKVVIVDYFKDALYKLKEKLGDVAALHTGDQKDEERADIVKKFQDSNSDLKVFLGTIQTCGYGLNLFAASKLFFMTLPYSVGEYDQVSDRLHRIGQKAVVNIYPLMFRDTIDDYVFSSIENKRKEIVKVIDNEDYKSDVSESVLSEVIKKIKEKHGK